jgi:hypothetical protein
MMKMKKTFHISHTEHGKDYNGAPYVKYRIKEHPKTEIFTREDKSAGSHGMWEIMTITPKGLTFWENIPIMESKQDAMTYVEKSLAAGIIRQGKTGKYYPF